LPELDGQVHHDTHSLPMGNYVIEVGKSLISRPSQVGNYKIADNCDRYLAPGSDICPVFLFDHGLSRGRRGVT
jgi:hypothetical protein